MLLVSMICLANKYNIKSYVESDDSPSRISAELSLVYIYIAHRSYAQSHLLHQHAKKSETPSAGPVRAKAAGKAKQQAPPYVPTMNLGLLVSNRAAVQ